MQILNETKGTILAYEADLAASFVRRLKGLLGKEEMDYGKGLVLEPCNSVHTCFMKFAIDVVMLDDENKVVGIYEFLDPYKFTYRHKEARRVVELPAGMVTRSRTSFGDRIKLEQ